MKVVVGVPSAFPLRGLVCYAARPVQRFLTETSGAVTAEFVIILPALLMMFVLVGSVSTLVVTSSEVQQVSFELTRGSLRYYEPGIQATALCADLKTILAPSVIKTGNFLSAERFTNIQCDLDASDALTVTVTYDLSNHPAVILGSFIGIDISQFTRTSKMWM
ncbi:MAG: TadE/TadG family type IV pilus assembly protein [Paracoccaceae bacterium]